jgi:abhydrolase domain-containing protein 12
LYAHKINTLFWQDIHDGEQFGFSKGQVTPFTIPTPDGQTLYAWHILPIDAYLRNEKALSETVSPQGPVENFTTTLPYSLLSSTSSPARVVINCELSLVPAWPNNVANNIDKSTAMLVTSPKVGEQIPIAT